MEIARDFPVMAALTVLLFAFCFRLRTAPRINRIKGGALLACYVTYTAYLIGTSFAV